MPAGSARRGIRARKSRPSEDVVKGSSSGVQGQLIISGERSPCGVVVVGLRVPSVRCCCCCVESIVSTARTTNPTSPHSHVHRDWSSCIRRRRGGNGRGRWGGLSSVHPFTPVYHNMATPLRLWLLALSQLACGRQRFCRFAVHFSIHAS